MIKPRKSIEDAQKVTIVFDVDMLDTLVKFLRCDSATYVQKNAVYKLMGSVKSESYEYNQDIKDRVDFLKALSTAICEEHLSDDSSILTYCKERFSGSDMILKNIDFEKNKLTEREINMVYKNVSERLQLFYVYQAKDEIINGLQSLDNVGFTSYHDDLMKMKEVLSKLMIQLQNISAPDELIKQFNFSGDQTRELLAQILERSKRPSVTLLTGIRQLNAILSPGFQSGRLYMLLGGTGKFKSGTLLNITDQIRQFNPQILPVENGMRKVLLFITMENTIYETIIRLVDMYNPGTKEINEMNLDELVALLREQGHFEFTSDSGIDIEMRYYSDLEIATSNIYTIIQELRDQGKQVISVILDYILKIDSAKEHYGDERLRLSYVGRELKALAQYFDIPVITAMQINREGNGILEAGMQENKEDVGRFIGTHFVGQCWDLIQESDWVCFVNLEQQRSSGKTFLTFKRLKIRGKKDPLAVDYFNHPFVNNNGIRLEPDVDKPEPISVISLASDLVNVDDNKLEKPEGSARNRPTVNHGKVNTPESESNKKNLLASIPLEGLLKSS